MLCVWFVTARTSQLSPSSGLPSCSGDCALPRGVYNILGWIPPLEVVHSRPPDVVRGISPCDAVNSFSHISFVAEQVCMLLPAHATGSDLVEALPVLRRPRAPRAATAAKPGVGWRRAGLLLLSASLLGSFQSSLHTVVLGVGSCRSRARTTLSLPAFFTAHLSLLVLSSALACVSSDTRCALVHCLNIGLALPTPTEHSETNITQWRYGLPSNPTYRLSAVALVPLVPCY